jgi:pyruvate dehydrogenase E2 component (dihydrolipoamide acetyltransferase)
MLIKARLSEELKDADQDVKLTVTALLAKAVVLALKEYGLCDVMLIEQYY